MSARITDEAAHGLDSSVEQIRDRALALGMLNSIQRELDKLRALLAPEAPDTEVSYDEQLRELTRAGNPDITSLQRAAALVGRTSTTISRLCRKNPGLGRKIGGQWEVSKSALLEFCRRNPADDRRD